MVKRETAWERYTRRRAENPGSTEVDWSAVCIVPDHCTSPCGECERDARRANERAAR